MKEDREGSSGEDEEGHRLGGQGRENINGERREWVKDDGRNIGIREMRRGIY